MRPGEEHYPARHVQRWWALARVFIFIRPWSDFSGMTRLIRNDGDLLIGMLALKRGLIDHVQLLSAFDAWEAGENASLAEILVVQGALEVSDAAAIEGYLDDSKGAISATVAYVRSDAVPEQHDSDARRRMPLEVRTARLVQPSDSASSGRMPGEVWARCFWLSTSRWIGRLRSRSFRPTMRMTRRASRGSCERRG